MNALQLRVIEMDDRSTEFNSSGMGETRNRKLSAQAENWSGFAEIDRAIAENRLTAYRWKKAWADPVARIGSLAIISVLLAFVAFVIAYDLLKIR